MREFKSRVSLFKIGLNSASVKGNRRTLFSFLRQITFERLSARLTVEVGSCNSFAAAVSVPAYATATNVRTSLRSMSFINGSFFSRTPALRALTSIATPFLPPEPQEAQDDDATCTTDSDLRRFRVRTLRCSRRYSFAQQLGGGNFDSIALSIFSPLCSSFPAKCAFRMSLSPGVQSKL